MTGKFKAVIFDFGGVFTTSPIENFAIYEKEHGLSHRFIGGVIKSAHHEGAFSRFERAEISLDEFDELFAKETRAAGFEIKGKEFALLLNVDLKPEMMAAHRAVKRAGLKTGCITNNFPSIESDGSARKLGDASRLRAIYQQFDHVIESSKVGVRKPEPRIYEMMIGALDVNAAECVFLDDLGVNLKPARDMGMTTIKVPFGDVTPAINELMGLLNLTSALVASRRQNRGRSTPL